MPEIHDVVEAAASQPTRQPEAPASGWRSLKLWKRVLIVVGVLLAILVIAAAWYVSDYYHADDVALAAMADADGASDGVVVRELSGALVAFVPSAGEGNAGLSDDASSRGLIFYPGAKVQPEAYAPLLTQLARQGVTCVLVRPLFNLAFLSASAPDGVQAQFPQVGSWFVAGHSLGGVVASNYVADHARDYEGLVLMAAYPQHDISSYQGGVLSLTGTEDRVIRREKLDETRDLLPPDASLLAIEGGNHAGYGNYGAQSGDGVASISSEEQQAQTVAATLDLMDKAA